MRTQQAENSSRHAVVMGSYQTTGWGEVAFEDSVEFDLLFVEVPHVSYGFSIVPDDDDDDASEILVDTRFPRCSGGVYGWRRNKRGFYSGGFCFVTVESRSPYITTTEAEPKYTLFHNFTFQGIAIKVTPDHFADN